LVREELHPKVHKRGRRREGGRERLSFEPLHTALPTATTAKIELSRAQLRREEKKERERERKVVLGRARINREPFGIQSKIPFL
jgi:hypothetical protein